MTQENLIRFEMFRANSYLRVLKSLARHFGGEVGRVIVANLRDADDRIGEYEKVLNGNKNADNPIDG